jgi:cysteinyl-tRNA synthetase
VAPSFQGRWITGARRSVVGGPWCALYVGEMVDHSARAGGATAGDGGAEAPLRLFDAATGTVRPLALRDPGRVSMYVCGPTVYDLPHLGHGRFALVFDVIRRYLTFRGLEVHHVSNVTDVDDKILDRATREGVTPVEVAERFEAAWWAAVDALGVLRPDATPHATEWVPAMVDLVADLVERGVAYELDDGVYLDVGQVPDYGLLALQPLSSLRAGARVEGHLAKRSPHDFALWKKVPGSSPADGVTTWPSPWGPGRPGWHTECVVMSLALLGEGFDLHGGGQDLRFPHHENERAQAVAAGRVFARHWAHNGFVEVGGEKMSKSLGNFTSLSDLLDQADPRAYRLLVLRSHYRRPIEVGPAPIADAQEALARLDALARRFPDAAARAEAASTDDRLVAAGADPGAVAAFCGAMDDDLDTPTALAGVFDQVRRANTAADAGDTAAATTAATTALGLAAAVGLMARHVDDALAPDVAALVAERDRARAARDFAAADAVRDQLVALGWIVEDGPEGTRLRRP